MRTFCIYISIILLFVAGLLICPGKSVAFDNLANISKGFLAFLLILFMCYLGTLLPRKKYVFLINTGKYTAKIVKKNTVFFSTTSLSIEIDSTPYTFVCNEDKIASILMEQFKEGEVVTIFVNSEDGNECGLTHENSCVSGYIRKTHSP